MKRKSKYDPFAANVARLRRQLYTIKEIARTLGVRDRTVSECVRVNGLLEVNRTWIIRLRKDGMSIKDISKMLGVRDRRVAEVVHSYEKR